MPAKGSGVGRVKGSPQLIARVSSDEFTRVEAFTLARGITQAELVRAALTYLEPSLDITVSPATIDALGLYGPGDLKTDLRGNGK